MNDFESSLNDMLVDTFNSILKFEEESLKTLNEPVTISEAHIIEAVGKQPDKQSTVSKIAAVLNIAMPTATVAVKKLEQKGFLAKMPCQRDGRQTIITLTDLGKKIDRAHQFFHRKMARHVAKQFDEAERDVLLKAIQTLNEFFKARVDA